jgi:hypothetical protein
VHQTPRVKYDTVRNFLNLTIQYLNLRNIQYKMMRWQLTSLLCLNSLDCNSILGSKKRIVKNAIRYGYTRLLPVIERRYHILYIAAKYGNTYTMRYLYSVYRYSNYDRECALCIAASHGHLQVLHEWRDFLDSRVYTGILSNEKFLGFVDSGNVHAVKFMTWCYMRSSNYQSAAIKFDDVELATLFIEDYEKALFDAITMRSDKCFDYLITKVVPSIDHMEHCASVGSARQLSKIYRGRVNIVSRAIYSSNLETLGWLLDQGCKIDNVDWTFVEKKVIDYLQLRGE